MPGTTTGRSTAAAFPAGRVRPRRPSGSRRQSATRSGPGRPARRRRGLEVGRVAWASGVGDCSGEAARVAIIAKPILLDVPEQLVTERMLLRIPRPGHSKFSWPAVAESQAELALWMPWG